MTSTTCTTSPWRSKTTTGRTKRREPGVVSSPDAAEAQPSGQRAGRRGHLVRLVRRRVRGEVDAAPRTRSGGGTRCRLSDLQIRLSGRIAGDRRHSRQPGERARRVRGPSEHSWEQRDLGVDPGCQERGRPSGGNRQHGPAVLPARALHRLPPYPEPCHQGHGDESGQTCTEAHLGEQDVAGLRGPVRHHAGQPGRHAQQLGAGILVQ